ncbi:MAG: IS1096 element passenger TnpR family protein [Planctomycetota bacterium]
MANKTPKSQGECRICGSTYTRTGMTRHIKSCVEQNRESRGARPVSLHHIVAQSIQPVFWLHFEVPSESTLETVDHFLRRIWLECCGHLSRFTINGQQYSPSPIDYMMGIPPEKSTDVPICDVLSNKAECEYEYDYGSTTNLELRVADVREGPQPEREVRVLARNEMPDWECVDCGKPATRVCPICWEDNLFCDECAVDHECYDDYGGLMPLVNSPRTGVCGYTGPMGDGEW